MDYYWNLGIETNNRFESYVLFYEILLVKHKKINTLNVVGDSKIIIILMISGSSPKDLSLNKIMNWIWLHSSGILMCFLHAYRHNNFEVDELANQEIRKSLRILGVNLEESYAPFPWPSTYSSPLAQGFLYDVWEVVGDFWHLFQEVEVDKTGDGKSEGNNSLSLCETLLPGNGFEWKVHQFRRDWDLVRDESFIGMWDGMSQAQEICSGNFNRHQKFIWGHKGQANMVIPVWGGTGCNEK